MQEIKPEYATVQPSEEVYISLRSWYLAKLRSEALIMVESAKLTPIARIEADRHLVEELIMASIPSTGNQADRPTWRPWLMWFGSVSASFLVVLFHPGTGGFNDFFEATFQVLIFKTNNWNWKLTPCAVNFLFFCGPALLLVSHSLWRCCSNTSTNSLSRWFDQIPVLLSIAVVVVLLWFQATNSSPVVRLLLEIQCWICLVGFIVSALGVLRQDRSQLLDRQFASRTQPLLRELFPEAELSHDIKENLLEALQAVSARERLIADFANDLILALDMNWRIQGCNRASIRLLGYIPQELHGRSLGELLLNGQNGLPDSSDKLSGAQLCCVSKNGDLVDFSITLDWSERKQLFFAMARNISDQKRVERARSEYLSMISHDVRTPLNSVLLGVDSVRTGLYGEVSPAIHGALQRAERNVERIIDFAGEIIDLERSSEFGIVLQKEDCSLHGIIEDAVDQTSDLAAHIGIVINSTSDAGTHIIADRKRVIRVLVNLLTNSIKYSAVDTPIMISVSVNPSQVQVSVEDKGPGIPVHLRRAVFNRYYQIKDEIIPQGHGFGLGLAICKVFVEAHGGVIGVECPSSGGSNFWFTLPRN